MKSLVLSTSLCLMSCSTLIGCGHEEEFGNVKKTSTGTIILEPGDCEYYEVIIEDPEQPELYLDEEELEFWNNNCVEQEE